MIRIFSKKIYEKKYVIQKTITGRKIIYSTHILHISYTYQYLICVVLYNMNAENPTHIVYT
jgi:hypothetical protein